MGKVPRSRKAAGGAHPAPVLAAPFQRFAELAAGQPVDAAGELEFAGALREGRWSCVLKVRDRARGEVRALKVVRPELVDDQRLRGALVVEAERAAAAATRSAARVLRVGPLRLSSEGGEEWWALSLEWLDGRTVRELLSGGTGTGTLSLGGLAEQATAASGAPASGLLAEQAFTFAEKAAAGVAELHKAGITHLDLRPEHLLLARRDAVRVLGHGLPVELRRRGDDVLGVPWRASAYAPPELALGQWEHLGPTTDVYQLALITYELFAGTPCSPWVGYDELCESVDYLAPDLDELIHDCLGAQGRRPADAGIFLSRLRAAARTFHDNLAHGRRRPERKAKEIWARAKLLAAGAAVPWGYVVGMCRRLLEEKPHLLPFGKIPVGEVRALLERAEGKLKQGRRVHLDALTARGAWPVATALVERWRGDVSAAEADDLRLALETARLTGAGHAAEDRAAAYERVVEVLHDAQPGSEQRERAVELLKELGSEPAAGAAPPAPVAANLEALPAVERWRVEVEGTTAAWRVVLGPALRLGRGSWDEFGNHVDLRPTRREAAESSITIALAQRLSRAGHLEFRVGAEGPEAFCLGTHGAVVDGRAIRRGQHAPLLEQGSFNLAEGAAAGTYRMFRGADDTPIAMELAITGGVGAGRRVAWVLTALPTRMLGGDDAALGLLVPTEEGWFVQVEGEGLKLSTQTLAPGARFAWPAESALRLSPSCRVMRG
jgi:serine/threonine protein kinase